MTRANAGMKVELTLTGPAPRWATAEKAKSANRNPSAKEFARFATDVAKHFKGRVQRYSIWNEPNWHTWLSPARTAAQQYRALFTGAYSSIKRVDSRSQVVFGELAPQARPGASFSPLRFMRDVLCVDAKYKKLKGSKCGSCPRGRRLAAPVRLPPRAHLEERARRRRHDRHGQSPHQRAHPLPPREGADHGQGQGAGRAPDGVRLLRQRLPRLPAHHPREVHHPGVRVARKNPKIAELLYFGLLQTPERQWNTGLLRPDGRPDDSFTSLKAWVERQRRAGLLRSPN